MTWAMRTVDIRLDSGTSWDKLQKHFTVFLYGEDKKEKVYYAVHRFNFALSRSGNLFA